MSSPQLQLVLWVSQPIIQAAIAVIAYRRKLHKQFPAFFTYVVAQILFFAVEFPFLRTHYYYDIFWAVMALNLVLAFKIIHEIFLEVFKPYPALKDLGAA